MVVPPWYPFYDNIDRILSQFLGEFISLEKRIEEEERGFIIEAVTLDRAFFFSSHASLDKDVCRFWARETERERERRRRREVDVNCLSHLSTFARGPATTKVRAFQISGVSYTLKRKNLHALSPDPKDLKS